MSNTLSIPGYTGLCLSYTDGMFLTAQTMSLDQAYFANWITLQNQLLYTPGVLSGLVPTLQGNAMSVSNGAAIDSSGNFLVLPQPAAKSPDAAAKNPYGLYLAFPAAPQPTTQPNVVSTLATLVNGPSNDDPAIGVRIALVNIDPQKPGVIASITDVREGVKSRLPIVIQRPDLLGAAAASEPPDLNGALRGIEPVDTTSLFKPGDRTSKIVRFRPDGRPAFTSPPFISATVLGPIPYALAVTGTDTAQFKLTLTAVQTRVDEARAVQVNWIALS